MGKWSNKIKGEQIIINLYLIFEDKEIINSFYSKSDAEDFIRISEKYSIKTIQIKPIEVIVGFKGNTLEQAKNTQIERILVKNDLNMTKSARELDISESNLRYHLCKRFNCSNNELRKVISDKFSYRLEKKEKNSLIRKKIACKRVINVVTLEEYESAKDASIQTGIGYKTLTKSLSKKDNRFNLKYK